MSAWCAPLVYLSSDQSQKEQERKVLMTCCYWWNTKLINCGTLASNLSVWKTNLLTSVIACHALHWSCWTGVGRLDRCTQWRKAQDFGVLFPVWKSKSQLWFSVVQLCVLENRCSACEETLWCRLDAIRFRLINLMTHQTPSHCKVFSVAFQVCFLHGSFWYTVVTNALLSMHDVFAISALPCFPVSNIYFTEKVIKLSTALKGTHTPSPAEEELGPDDSWCASPQHFMDQC